MTVPADVRAELKHVARRGRADEAAELVEAVVDAYEREDFAEALGPGLKAKEIAPRSATVRELLGLVHYRLGRWKEAQRELAAYRRLSGRHDEDHVLADCERALGRPQRALEILDGMKSSEVGEEVLVEGLVVAAGALEDLGRHSEAVELLMRGPVRPRAIRPYHLRLWYSLADALEKAGRRRESRPWWDMIYAEDPDFFDVAERRLRG